MDKAKASVMAIWITGFKFLRFFSLLYEIISYFPGTLCRDKKKTLGMKEK